MADEIEGDCGFFNPADADEFSWPAQFGATSCEVARSSHADLSGDCTTYPTSDTYWVDATDPTAGVCFHYLVRR